MILGEEQEEEIQFWCFQRKRNAEHIQQCQVWGIEGIWYNIDVEHSIQGAYPAMNTWK